jgi:hypothetical protein
MHHPPLLPLFLVVGAAALGTPASARPPALRPAADQPVDDARPAKGEKAEGKKAEAKKAVETGIAWKIEPGTVTVYLDDKSLGAASTLGTTETKPGPHVIRLVNGGDETEFEVRVKKGEVLQVEYEFSD